MLFLVCLMVIHLHMYLLMNLPMCLIILNIRLVKVVLLYFILVVAAMDLVNAKFVLNLATLALLPTAIIGSISSYMRLFPPELMGYSAFHNSYNNLYASNGFPYGALRPNTQPTPPYTPSIYPTN